MAHLMIVDDDDVLRTVMARLLANVGHTVVEAGDGAAALAIAGRDRLDLIVVDVMMPDMDGYELTARLRALPEMRATPILLLTASLHGPDPRLAEAAGADAYAMKTTSAGRLAQQVAELLATGRRTRDGSG
jgi:CheY-like chemotaxis protein